MDIQPAGGAAESARPQSGHDSGVRVMGKPVALHDISLKERGRWHLLAAATIGGWLLIGLVSMAVFVGGAGSRWWSIHTLTLGVIATAIMVYSTHFVEALTRTGTAAFKWVAMRVAGVQVGLVLLGVGRAGVAWNHLADAGATLVLAAAAWQLAWIFRRLRGSLSSRFAATVPFYIAAFAFLIVAIALVLGAVHGGGSHYSALVAAHSRATMDGFALLTALGTVVTLLPTLSGGVIAPQVMPRLPRILGVYSVALLGVLLCLALGVGRLAGVLLLAAVTAAVCLVQPVIAHALVGNATGTAGWSTLAALLMVLGAVAADATLLVAGADPRAITAAITPMFVGGFVFMILGVLHHLLGVLVGRGPTAVRLARARANVAGPARITVIVAGALFTLIAPLRPVGIVLMALGLLAHAAWVVSATVVQLRYQAASPPREVLTSLLQEQGFTASLARPNPAATAPTPNPPGARKPEGPPGGTASSHRG